MKNCKEYVALRCFVIQRRVNLQDYRFQRLELCRFQTFWHTSLLWVKTDVSEEHAATNYHRSKMGCITSPIPLFPIPHILSNAAS